MAAVVDTAAERIDLFFSPEELALTEANATNEALLRQLRRRTPQKHREALRANRIARCDRVMAAVEAHYPEHPVEALATQFLRGGLSKARRVSYGVEDLGEQDVDGLIEAFGDPAVRALIDEQVEEMLAKRAESDRGRKDNIENIRQSAYDAGLEAAARDDESGIELGEELGYADGYDEGCLDGIAEGRAASPAGPRREDFLAGLTDVQIERVVTGDLDAEQVREMLPVPTEGAAYRVLAALIMEHRWRFDSDQALKLVGIDPTMKHLMAELIERIKQRLGSGFLARIRHTAIDDSWFAQTGLAWIDMIGDVIAAWRNPLLLPAS